MNQEDKDLYLMMLKSRDERTLLQCIGMLLLDIYDEIKIVPPAQPVHITQKETPRPGRQPATTKG